MSNYPDDIRRFDTDPRSPFYEGGVVCADCGDEMNEIDTNLFKCDACDVIVNTEPDDEPDYEYMD